MAARWLEVYREWQIFNHSISFETDYLSIHLLRRYISPSPCWMWAIKKGVPLRTHPSFLKHRVTILRLYLALLLYALAEQSQLPR